MPVGGGGNPQKRKRALVQAPQDAPCAQGIISCIHCCARKAICPGYISYPSTCSFLTTGHFEKLLKPL